MIVTVAGPGVRAAADETVAVLSIGKLLAELEKVFAAARRTTHGAADGQRT